MAVLSRASILPDFLRRGPLWYLAAAMMYGVAALGEAGVEHVIDLLQEEVRQVMEQLRCELPQAMVNHSVSHEGVFRCNNEISLPK